MKSLFAVPALFLLMASCIKNNKRVIPSEKISKPADVSIEGLGVGYAQGNVQLHHINEQGLYVIFAYNVQGDVTRIKEDGRASLDVNDLKIGGHIKHIITTGRGSSTWIYDIIAITQALAISKTYAVGVNYNGNIKGQLYISKKRRVGYETEFLATVNFSKNFSGVVAVPPPAK